MNTDRPIDPPEPPVRRWPRASLRTTLVLISLAATLPLALLLSFWILAEGRQQRDVLAAHLSTTARAVGEAVDRELTASRDALQGLTGGDALQRGDLATFEARLRLRGPLRPSWNRVVLLDTDGGVRFAVDGSEAGPSTNAAATAPPPTTPAEARALAAAWARGGAAGVLIDLPGGAATGTTWIGVPATSGTGERYLLAARVGLAAWQALLDGLAPAGGFVTLFDAQHRVLARTLDAERFVGQPLPASAVAGMGSAPAGHQKTALLGGGQSYLAWQQLRTADWGVGVGVDAAPFDAAQARARLGAFGAAAICVLLGVGLSLWIARRISEPLAQLVHGRAARADGPIAVTEIAQLRDAFDASERARAAATAELLRKAAEFETLFRNCPTGLAFAQDRACANVLRNAAMDELLPGAGVGPAADALEVHADGRRLAAHEQPLAVAAREGRPVAPIELEVRRAGHVPSYLLASAVPMPEAGGALASVTDVTARRVAERERDDLMAREMLARQDAEAASHAKDELLSMLGHELRNPLNALATSAEVLRGAPPGSAIAESARGVVSRQTRKLSMLIDRILDVGRIMADDITLAMQPVELEAAVQNSLAIAMPQAVERRHALELVAPASVWVRADPARVAQLLAQLLDNALKHTVPGATVTVEVRRDGRDAVLAVRDTGPGIDATLLPRVFEPFVQGRRGLDRASGGLGVGLALVKRIAELHGGTIGVTSSAAGSAFEWRLAAIDPPAAGAEAARRRIGVVDDNPDALASMRSMLELAGHRVSTAADGLAGLAMVLGEWPDIALVDIGLPGIDGYEIARRCRSAGYRGRMIALSGYGLAHDLKRSVAEGFDAHLVKPIDPGRLLALLHQD